MWFIENDLSKVLLLPKHYGIDDFPLMIQDNHLDNFSTPVYNLSSDGVFMGDILLVNGVQNPYVNVSCSWRRLRFLNGSNSRRFDLSFSDNRPVFWLPRWGCNIYHWRQVNVMKCWWICLKAMRSQLLQVPLRF